MGATVSHGRRPWLVFSVAAAAVAWIGAWMILRDAAPFTNDKAWAALLAGFGIGDAPGTDVAIVWELRVPRLLVAIFAGASLALAGAIMQAVFRNPLASPDIMGTQAGSALGAVIAIALGFASSSVLALPLFAFIGAIAVSSFVYAAAAGRGGSSVTGILLAGMAMNALVGALTAFCVSMYFREYDRSREILQWLMGGLDNSDMSNALIVGAGLLLFSLATVPFVRDMDLLTLRDESAESLGVTVKALRVILLFVACGVTATAVSSTGGIAFVGLVVPHMLRLLVGPSHRRLLPCAAAGGALIMVVADGVCQLTRVEVELRIGVVTAMLGAPFFLYLLARHRRGYSL